MFTLLQSLDLIQQAEKEPTPVWRLAKAAGVTEKSMLHVLGLHGIPVVYDDKSTAHISKANVRGRMGIADQL